MTKSIILVPLLAAALSVPVQAQEVSVSVNYGDLNLAGDSGVKRLDDRIRNAVEHVCGIPREQKSLTSARSSRKCGRETWADIESPRQVAIERARGRVPSVELADARSPSALTVTVRRR